MAIFQDQRMLLLEFHHTGSAFVACLPDGQAVAFWELQCYNYHLHRMTASPACAGVDCDVSIGSSNAIFKAKAFKALAARERRFADMLRLVKAWAGVHGLNDAADGTFNSFALGLMVGAASLLAMITGNSDIYIIPSADALSFLFNPGPPFPRPPKEFTGPQQILVTLGEQA